MKSVSKSEPSKADDAAPQDAVQRAEQPIENLLGRCFLLWVSIGGEQRNEKIQRLSQNRAHV